MYVPEKTRYFPSSRHSNFSIMAFLRVVALIEEFFPGVQQPFWWRWSFLWVLEEKGVNTSVLLRLYLSSYGTRNSGSAVDTASFFLHSSNFLGSHPMPCSASMTLRALFNSVMPFFFFFCFMLSMANCLVASVTSVLKPGVFGLSKKNCLLSVILPSLLPDLCPCFRS